MEKHLQFNTILRKAQNMQSSICVDAQCNIISKRGKKWIEKVKTIYILSYDSFVYSHIVHCYLSSKFVVAVEFKTMSISFHISSLNVQYLIPKFSSQTSPEIGVTLSEINYSRFASKLFLITINRSFPSIYK